MTVITADNADVLDGTDLANFNPDSAAIVYIASTQNDSVLILTAPEEGASAVKIRVPQRTNGMPLESDDPGIVVAMPSGGHLKVDVDIVTAATVGILVKEVP